MNYLQLVNDFLEETSMEDPIDTVVGQIDDGAKACMWVRDAWLQIQRSQTQWKFRWAEGSFDTEADKDTYTLAEQNLAAEDVIDRRSLVILSERVELDEVSRRSLRWKVGEGVPRQFAQAPNGDLVLHYTPDAAYTINYEYWAAPVTLAADTDTPSLDPSFHKAIVWLAVKNYAREQGKEWHGLYQTAGHEFVEIHNTMLRLFLPKWGGKVGL